MGGELLLPPTGGLEAHGFPRTRKDKPAASAGGGSRLMTGGGYGAVRPDDAGALGFNFRV